MLRWCSKLRSLAAFPKPLLSSSSSSSSHRLLHISSHSPFSASSVSPSTFNAPSHFPLLNPTSLIQVRHITAKQRLRHSKVRRPPTPIVSKVKKTKIKGYSSFKGRFRLIKNGQIRRWHEGKAHNAHPKSKQAKRRLRLPGTVPVAYAKVMKKLGFCN